jgi:hypothetical protein
MAYRMATAARATTQKKPITAAVFSFCRGG